MTAIRLNAHGETVEVFPNRRALADMTADRWAAMAETEREAVRDLGGLSEQLKGFEGWRVEVVDSYDEKRRFIVGRSTGWRPCNLELHNRSSSGGHPAERSYKSVRPLERIR